MGSLHSSGSLCGTLRLSDTPRLSDPLHDEARAKLVLHHLCPPWWHQAGCLWQASKRALVQRAGSGEASGDPRWPEARAGVATPVGLKNPLVFLLGRPLRLLAPLPPCGSFGSPVSPALPGFLEPSTPQQRCPGGRGMGTVSPERPARQTVTVFGSAGQTDLQRTKQLEWTGTHAHGCVPVNLCF